MKYFFHWIKFPSIYSINNIYLYNIVVNLSMISSVHTAVKQLLVTNSYKIVVVTW